MNKGLLCFVIAYFMYIDGVDTVISISTAYGTTLGLGSVGMILALLVTQIVAVPCSIWFSKLSEKISARRAISGAVIIYTIICIVGFYMGFSLEPHQAAYDEAIEEEFAGAVGIYSPEEFGDNATEGYITAYNSYIDQVKDTFLAKDRDEKLAALELTTDSTDEATKVLVEQMKEPLKETVNSFVSANIDVLDNYVNAIGFSTFLFWCMAFLVGTVQGGIQAVSRSYYGKLVPKERSNEFFGFFDIFGKFAAVIGPAMYAFISNATGRSSYGVLCLIVLFMIGLIVLTVGRKEMDKLAK